MAKKKIEKQVPVWKSQKRNVIGLPLTFTKYILYEDKLIIRKGFFNIVEDEIELYRVKDKRIELPFIGRIFNYGTIRLHASTVYNAENVLDRIHNVRYAAQLIEEYVDRERDKYNVRGRDMVGESGIKAGQIDSDGDGVPDIVDHDDCCECDCNSTEE